MTKKYLRMTLNERIQHLNLAVNFTLLVITGFALSFSTAFWVAPIKDLSMGMTYRGFLHRLCGVALVFLSGYHILYLAFTERGRGIVKDMIPGLKDAKDLWETLKNNFFINRPAKVVKMPRFNFREKLEYLGLIWGTIVMTVTGFILWFKTAWLMYFPMWTWDVAEAIHFYEAVLATLTIIVWHLYSVVWNPDVYPMSWAWITGDLTEHEMEEEHGMELERIKAQPKGEMREYAEAAAVGGGRVYAIRRETTEQDGRKTPSPRRFYKIVQGFNETIKNWKGT
ncbi:MAG TPA: cytochrome b/b6 domain-containing protein [Thermodesulfobacteriota bacterium]|nr:cytochrome b/b6 domain-containing protein [Thermodesulfobacteriota bacterium]